MTYTNRHDASANSANGSSDNLEERMWKLKVTDDNQENGDDQYPDRPGEPDCIFYLKNGSCAYGSKCKYNHPENFNGQADIMQGNILKELPQREGQPDCQFFLKTGYCKFGSTCKYHHPQAKLDGQKIPLNALGLPIRKDEKSCPYYMRTTWCKFGVACKFNHPEPSTFGAMSATTESSVYGGYTNSWAPQARPPIIRGSSLLPLPRNPPWVQGHPAYTPVVLPSNVMQQGWSTYLSNVGIPTSESFGSTQVFNSAYYMQPGSSTSVLLPEKPHQPVCQYYMKTGNCKYGNACKYSHPQERNQAAACMIGPLGLPLRPGLPVCVSYTTHGSCKYGASCKFDHPIMGYYNYPAAVFAVQEPSVLLANQRGLILTLAENSAQKTLKDADKLAKSEKIVELNDTANSDHDEPSPVTSPSHTVPHSDSAQNQSD